jgi:hypothetical protein
MEVLIVKYYIAIYNISYYINTFPYGWKVNKKIKINKYKLKCNWKPELLKMYFIFFLSFFYTTLQRVIIMPKIIFFYVLYKLKLLLIDFSSSIVQKYFVRMFFSEYLKFHDSIIYIVIFIYIYIFLFFILFFITKKKQPNQVINYIRIWQCRLRSCGTINGLNLYN